MSKGKFLKDLGIYGLGDFVLHAISFLTFPIFTRVFSVVEYSIIELIVSFCTIVAVIFNCGLNNACQRYYLEPDNSPGYRKNVVSSGLFLLVVFAIGTTAVCVCITFFTRDYLKESYSIPWILLAIALIGYIPFQMVQYSQDVIRLYFQPFKFTVVSFIKNLGTVGFQLLLVVLLGFGLTGYFFGNMVVLFLILPVSLYFIRKDITTHIDRSMCSNLITFGYPFIFTNIAYWLFSSVDRWLLAEYSDLTQVGLYGIAFKICTILIFINMAFGQAWSPYAFNLYAEQKNYRKIYGEILISWTYLLIVIATGLGLFSYEILAILTPKEYWDAALVISVLAFGMVLSGTMQITAIGISLERKTKIFSYISWSAAALNVILNIAMIPALGALGAAIATLISYLFISMGYLYFSQRYHPMELEKKPLLIVAGIFLISLAVVVISFTPSFSIPVIAGKIIFLFFICISGLFFRLIPIDIISVIREFTQRKNGEP